MKIWAKCKAILSFPLFRIYFTQPASIFPALLGGHDWHLRGRKMTKGRRRRRRSRERWRWRRRWRFDGRDYYTHFTSIRRKGTEGIQIFKVSLLSQLHLWWGSHICKASFQSSRQSPNALSVPWIIFSFCRVTDLPLILVFADFPFSVFLARPSEKCTLLKYCQLCSHDS